MSLITHMTSAEKTIAIIVLAEALQAATSVGEPAPRVARLRDWMHAPLRVGDLVVEMSTAHRGPDLSRAGVVLKVSRHRSAYKRVTEILVLDPPCGKISCGNQKCIHRRCWSNATFIRVPATAEQLTEALGREAQGGSPGIARNGLIAALADAGFEVQQLDLKVGAPGVRDPEHPCADYNPTPGGPGTCNGDGHYLCKGCRHHVESSVPSEEHTE